MREPAHDRGGADRCPHGLGDACAICHAPPTLLELALALHRATDTIEGSLEEYRKDCRADPAVAADVAADVAAEIAEYRDLLARAGGPDAGAP